MVDDVQELAEILQERGNIPPKRARVVALVDAGYSYREVAEILGMENPDEVSTHVKRYRDEDLEHAKWLVENGADI
ncbi:helix-turn-helix domain-containing protein [Halocatena halophila]|uniref:helix-turn-helix domain-containing protein n=1 Tax=Halocatena halophila TaxID=2814576 RepID=UPI002ED2EED2